jgi:hypothetical protein
MLFLESDVSIGFPPEHLWAARLQVRHARYPNAPISRLPGIERAAAKVICRLATGTTRMASR